MKQIIKALSTVVLLFIILHSCTKSNGGGSATTINTTSGSTDYITTLIAVTHAPTFTDSAVTN